MGKPIRPRLESFLSLAPLRGIGIDSPKPLPTPPKKVQTDPQVGPISPRRCGLQLVGPNPRDSSANTVDCVLTWDSHGGGDDRSSPGHGTSGFTERPSVLRQRTAELHHCPPVPLDQWGLPLKALFFPPKKNRKRNSNHCDGVPNAFTLCFA